MAQQSVTIPKGTASRKAIRLALDKSIANLEELYTRVAAEDAGDDEPPTATAVPRGAERDDLRRAMSRVIDDMEALDARVTALE
jgi:hypothetical protein